MFIMKKLLFVLLLLPVFLFSQERSSVEKGKFLKIHTRFNKAVGWTKLSNGDWVDKPNRIPWQMEKDDILYNSGKYGLGYHNFGFYRISEFTYKKDTLIGVTMKYKDGYYEYPSIFRGWYTNTDYVTYLIKKEDFETTPLTEDEVVVINLPVFSIVYLDKFSYNNVNDKNYLSKTASKISENKSKYDDYLLISYGMYKEKNISQFIIIGYTNHSYESASYSYTEYSASPGFYFSSYDSSNSKPIERLLNKEMNQMFYYETDYLSFKNFITPFQY